MEKVNFGMCIQLQHRKMFNNCLNEKIILNMNLAIYIDYRAKTNFCQTAIDKYQKSMYNNKRCQEIIKY